MGRLGELRLSMKIDTPEISRAFAGFGAAAQAITTAGQLYGEIQLHWGLHYPGIPADEGIALIRHIAARTPHTTKQIAYAAFALSHAIPPVWHGFPARFQLPYLERAIYRFYGYRVDNPRDLVYPHLPNAALLRAYQRRRHGTKAARDRRPATLAYAHAIRSDAADGRSGGNAPPEHDHGLNPGRGGTG